MDGALNRAFETLSLMWAPTQAAHVLTVRAAAIGCAPRLTFAAAAPTSESVSSVCNLLHNLQPSNCVKTLTDVALSSVACVVHWPALVLELHDNDTLVLADMHPTPMPRSQICGLSHLVLSEVGYGALPVLLIQPQDCMCAQLRAKYIVLP